MRHRTIATAAAVIAALTCVAVPATATATTPATTSAPAFVSGTTIGAGTDSLLTSVFANLRSSSTRLDAVGLADGGKTLVQFVTDRPERASKVGTISGLTGDTFLVGIDYRVQNGKLYGVGNSGGIYTLSAKDAKAAKVGQLSVALSGTYYGVDFNPSANALRVVSDNGQNLRQPFGTTDGPTAATVADAALNYTAGTPAAGIAAVAYTNNDLSADSATTLFDLDSALDQIAIQAPANAGSLSATGKLGVNADPDAGFDIYSTVRNDRSVDVIGFAVIGVGGSYRVYATDLLTGLVEDQGKFKFPVTDIAVGLNQR